MNKDYDRGERAAWATMLRECCKHLGYESAEAQKAAWIQEREELVATLRLVCDHYGDNDWPDSLNLSDVIEKHLVRHLPNTQTQIL
jgi:hypothetical protein